MSDLNPALVAWNKANRLRRLAMAGEFQNNMAKPGVAAVTDKRQARHFAPHSSSSDAFRMAPSFEHEARFVAEDLARLPSYISAKINAKQKRVRIGTLVRGEDGLPWHKWLAAFFHEPENRHAPLPDVWQNLITRLGDIQCDPKEMPNHRDPRKTTLTFNYQASGGAIARHSLTYGRFANLRSHWSPKRPPK
jgi:hypothetical protein